MPTYQFQTIMKGPSGLPEDVFVNGWHFEHAGGQVSDFDNVRDMIRDFYIVTQTNLAVQKYISSILDDVVTVKAYNLDEPKPRVPSYTSTFTMTSQGTGTPMPFECALCLSFEAKPLSGQVQARRRNRLFLGPLASSAMFSDARPIANARVDILEAAKDLRAASEASVNWKWCVYSTFLEQQFPIQHIWVDDAWDTQRRRGLRPTQRSEVFY